MRVLEPKNVQTSINGPANEPAAGRHKRHAGHNLYVIDFIHKIVLTLTVGDIGFPTVQFMAEFDER